MNRRDSVTSRLKETERRERRRKGLPPLKEDHLVGSFTRTGKLATHTNISRFFSELEDTVAWPSAENDQRNRSPRTIGTSRRNQRH